MWAHISFVLSQITRLTNRRTNGQHSQGYIVRCIAWSRTVKSEY